MILCTLRQHGIVRTKFFIRATVHTPCMRHPTVLIVVDLPDPTDLSEGFHNGLAYPDAEVIGIREVGEDESEAELQAAHDEAYQETIDTIAERLEQEGIRADTDVVYATDWLTAREQIANRDGVDAILLPGAAHTIGRVLVGVKDTSKIESLARVFDIVDTDQLIEVTVFHVADQANEDDPEATAAAQELLDTATEAFMERGIDEMALEQQLVWSDDAAFELCQAAREHDLAVVGETERDIEDQVFGPIPDQIVDQSGTPVLIMQ